MRTHILYSAVLGLLGVWGSMYAGAPNKTPTSTTPHTNAIPAYPFTSTTPNCLQNNGDDQESLQESLNDKNVSLALYSEWDNLTRRLQGCIVTVSRLFGTKNNLIPTKKRTRSVIGTVRDWLSQHNTALCQLQSNRPVPLDQNALTMLASQSERHATQVLNSLNNKFDDLKAQLLIDTNENEKPTISTLPLPEILDSLRHEVETIEKTIQSTGLTRFNKLCRAIRATNQKLALTKSCKRAAIALFVGSLICAIAKKDAKIIKKCNLQPFQNLSKRIWNTIIAHLSDSKTITLKDALTIAGGSCVLAEKVGAYTELYGFKDWYAKRKKSVADRLLGTSHDITNLDGFGETPRLNDPFFDKLQEQTKPLRDLLCFLEKPEQFIRIGIQPPKSLLFTGASGNGKTFTLDAFCASVNDMLRTGDKKKNLAIIKPSMHELISFNIESGNAIKNVFEEAKNHAPCVIFLDEFHLLGLQVERNVKTLMELLTTLDEINKNGDPDKQVIFIAATNRPDLLDPALKRPGRFDATIQCDYPSMQQREHLLSVLCQKAAIQKTDLMQKTLRTIVELTEGCSFSMINTIFSSALYQAKIENRGMSETDLYQAFCHHVRHLVPQCTLSEDSQKHIAAYIAGQAIAMCLLPTQEKLEAVTIQQYVPQTQEHGCWEKDQTKDLYKQSFGHVFVLPHGGSICDPQPSSQDIIALLCGTCSEEILLDSSSPTYGQTDRDKAIQVIQTTLCNGIKFDAFNKKQQEAIRAQAAEKFREYKKQARQFIETHRQIVANVQETLIKKQYLRRPELDDLITPHGTHALRTSSPTANTVCDKLGVSH